MRKEPAPFIYERLGERYHHFLIDEFQDTSVMQWHNLGDSDVFYYVLGALFIVGLGFSLQQTCKTCNGHSRNYPLKDFVFLLILNVH
ncbi:UvrD-helicase domain-containing protein [bacterium]|nr:UvrD-helicase domain-containing protein [bacterium]